MYYCTLILLPLLLFVLYLFDGLNERSSSGKKEMTNDTRFCHRLSIRRSHHQKIVTHTHTHKPHSFIPSCIHHSSSSPQQKRRTFEKCITIDSLCGHRYQSFRSLVALLFIHFRSIFSKTSQCDILAHDLLALFPPQKMCFEIFTTLLFFLLKR